MKQTMFNRLGAQLGERAHLAQTRVAIHDVRKLGIGRKGRMDDPVLDRLRGHVSKDEKISDRPNAVDRMLAPVAAMLEGLGNSKPTDYLRTGRIRVSRFD